MLTLTQMLVMILLSSGSEPIKVIHMKLTSVSVPMTSGRSFGQNENSKDRLTRMRLFWQDKANAVLFPVGKLLSAQASKTQTIADVLASGGEVEMDSITVGGKVLSIAPSHQKLSLSNAPTTWACPACRSAHGSGIYPSQKVDADLLADNKFFYRPSDKVLFSISVTCWRDYITALGANTPERFRSASEAPVPKQEPKQEPKKIETRNPAIPAAIAPPSTKPEPVNNQMAQALAKVG
jgi:hypothetical protein